MNNVGHTNHVDLVAAPLQALPAITRELRIAALREAVQLMLRARRTPAALRWQHVRRLTDLQWDALEAYTGLGGFEVKRNRERDLVRLEFLPELGAKELRT